MKKNKPFGELFYHSLKKTFGVICISLILLTLGILQANAGMQQKTLSGVVSDKAGLALPGVNVVVTGTTTGTMSDLEGKYTLSVPAGSTSLTFSFIGMQPQEVPIGVSTKIDVILVEEATALEEVIVVGYGTKIKRSVTGAISQVNQADIQAFSASNNVADALQASVSGAFVLSNSGRPGDVANIYLRGPVSVNGGNPLYVVDGIPQDNLGYNFNMADVESVSVLKDASAAAIYGAKAAGGVILITTKRGTKSKLKINFSGSYGIRKAISIPKFMDRDQYIKARGEYGNDLVNLYGPQSGWSSLPNTDWMKEMFHLGVEQNYGLSLTGGSDVNTFFISGGYNKVVGVGIGNWIQRYTLRVNTDQQISRKLKFSQGFYFKNGLEDPSSDGGTGAIFRKTPVMAVYDPLAITNRGYARVIKGFQGVNQVQSIMDRYERNKDYSINLTGTLTYNIIKGLNASVFGGTTMLFGDTYTYIYEVDDAARVSPPSIAKGQSNAKDYIVTYTLNYDKTFDKHHITALAGYEARKRETASVDYGNSTMLVPVAQSSTLALSTLSATGAFAQGNVTDRILSQFGRLEYSYGNKYLLTANVRRDGYGSKFGPANKFGVFPGISAGWVLSEESFLKSVKAINMLKLRAGYGLLGNAVGTDFAYSSYYGVGYAVDYSATNDNFKAPGIALASQLANPDIKWESVATTNIGIDGAVWKNQLTFNIDYYSRQTKEMLYNVPIAPSAGVGTAVQANVGQMSNKGIEFNMELRREIGKFNLNIGVNAGHNKNELISLSPDIAKLYIASGVVGGNGESGSGIYGSILPNRSEPGMPLGLFYGYQTAGIYATDIAAGEVRPKYNNYTPTAGDLIFVDRNGDGKITVADQTYIGNPWPKFTYGLTVGANWKNMVDLKAIFNGVYGNDIFNVYESYTHNLFSDYTSAMPIYETSFWGTNGLTNVPRAATLTKPDNNGNWGLISDYHIQKGSYLMLKNIQLGFTLPKNASTWLGVSKLKAYISAENLLTVTKYKGLSPVIPPNQRSILAQGTDNPSGRYPFSKLYTVGVNIEF